ncbi:sporulation protein [Actinoplanes sp. KI2]|uniref:sporulation protein n=1 Tax=Actinoplanes sp. KI2 TaxID=2983315 RepID=UPI0021D5DCE1|nr:sporulation protein [Actinoplanes sp. KI2]MCU7723799.1 sporulation protein [Actinoplanes sp. KI2]
MVFKKMMRAFGVGGPSVDTVLANPNTRPGLALDGTVRILGGDHDVTVERVVLGLVTRVEHEHGDSLAEFHRLPVTGAFALRAGEQRDLPFSLPVPWETPITDVYGRRLHGMTMGLRTELAVANAVDKGDLDQVAVHPLPAQERILDAFAHLGFRFARADLEHGRIHGVHQQLPFYQEIEFYPPPQYAGAINEVEVTFIADPSGVEVVLEFDKRGGFLTPGHDTYGRFRVAHAEAETTDWAAVVDSWISEAAGRYPGMRSAPGYGGYGAPAGHGGYGAPAGHGGYGAPAGHGGHGAPAGYGGHGAPAGYGGHGPHGYGHHGHYRRGGGAGAMAAGIAGGVLGGFALGEVFDEVFDGDDGDSGD